MSMKDKTLLARRIAMGLIIAANSCMAGVAMAEPEPGALPQGWNPTAGGINITDDGSGHMTINQTTDKGIIDWQSFNIGRGASVTFNHQDSAGMTLNRVTGGSMSEIYGHINANGSVILVNPNGAYFAESSTVNTAGFIVATSDMTNEDFMNGNYVWDQTSAKNSNITVEGTIVVTPGNTASALSYANNKIMLIADGDVTVGKKANLIANTSATINTDKTLNDGFTAKGDTITSEGTIILRADQNADDVAQRDDEKIANLVGSAYGDEAYTTTSKGVTAAENQSFKTAKVYLMNNSATQIQGVNVSVYYNSDIVNGINGTTVSNIGVNNGNDSAKFTQKDYRDIDNEVNAYKGKIDLNIAKNVTVASLVNNIYQLQAIQDVKSVSDASGETLSATKDKYYGNLSGSYALGTDIQAADTANWIEDTTSTSAGFNPIGNQNESGVSSDSDSNREFTGSFTGKGGSNTYGIYDLTINRSDENNVGLFAVTDGATISSTTLVNPYIVGSANVGGIAGAATNSFFDSNTVTGGQTIASNVYGEENVGGIIGYAKDTATRNSINTATVYGTHDVGGLIGRAVGNGEVTTDVGDTINYDYVSYNGRNYGKVIGTQRVGGLIGTLTDGGTITGDKDSYNSGRITGLDGGSSVAQYIGGLVGYMSDSKITNSYNTNEGSKVSSSDYFDSADSVMGLGSWGAGSVTGYQNVGGLVGGMLRSSLDTVYNAGNVEGNTNVGGLVGEMSGDVSTGSSINNAYNADNNTVYLSENGDGEYNGFIYQNTAGQKYKYTYDQSSQTWSSYIYDVDSSVWSSDRDDLSTATVLAEAPESGRLYLNRMAYRDATVTGNENVGGLVGVVEDANNSLTNTYNAGRVKPDGATNVGSLVGLLIDADDLEMSEGTSQNGNFVVTTQNVTGKNIVKGDYDDMKVVGGSVDGDDNATDRANNYNSGSYEKTFFQASNPLDDGVAWTNGKNQNDKWIIYSNSTTPLLKQFMTGITNNRQYVYDGTVHNLTTEGVDNYYGGVFFTGGKGQNVYTAGVDEITESKYNEANWEMGTNKDGITASTSDSYEKSSYYKYDSSNMWSPQNGYYTDEDSGVIITPKNITATFTAEKTYGQKAQGYVYKDADNTYWSYDSDSKTWNNVGTDMPKGTNGETYYVLTLDDTTLIGQDGKSVLSHWDDVTTSGNSSLGNGTTNLSIDTEGGRKKSANTQYGLELSGKIGQYNKVYDNAGNIVDEYNTNNYNINYQGSLKVNKADLIINATGGREYGEDNGTSGYTFTALGTSTGENSDNVNDGKLKSFDTQENPQDVNSLITSANLENGNSYTLRATENTKRGDTGTAYYRYIDEYTWVAMDENGNQTDYTLGKGSFKLNGYDSGSSQLISDNYNIIFVGNAEGSQVASATDNTYTSADAYLASDSGKANNRYTINPADVMYKMYGYHTYGDIGSQVITCVGISGWKHGDYASVYVGDAQRDKLKEYALEIANINNDTHVKRDSEGNVLDVYNGIPDTSDKGLIKLKNGSINYNLKPDLLYTVYPGDVFIDVSDAEKTYGQSNFTGGGASFTGFKNGDTSLSAYNDDTAKANVTPGTGNALVYMSDGVNLENQEAGAGTYTDAVRYEKDLYYNDYDVFYSRMGTATINKANLIINATGEREYGEDNGTSGYTFTALGKSLDVNSDELNNGKLKSFETQDVNSLITSANLENGNNYTLYATEEATEGSDGTESSKKIDKSTWVAMDGDGNKTDYTLGKGSFKSNDSTQLISDNYNIIFVGNASDAQVRAATGSEYDSVDTYLTSSEGKAKNSYTINPVSLEYIIQGSHRYGDIDTQHIYADYDGGLKDIDNISDYVGDEQWERLKEYALDTANINEATHVKRDSEGNVVGVYNGAYDTPDGLIKLKNGSINYNFKGYQFYVVEPGTVTVKVSDAEKTYGDSSFTTQANVTFDGFKNNENAETAYNDNVKPNVIPDAEAALVYRSGNDVDLADQTAGAGTYTDAVRLSSNLYFNDYTVNYKYGTVVINPKTINYVISDAEKIYGETTTESALSGQFDPAALVGNDNFEANISSEDFSSVGLQRSAGVGEYDISLTEMAQNMLPNSLNQNYTLGNVVGGKLTVNQREVDWNTDNVSREYLTNDPFYSGHFSAEDAVGKTGILAEDANTIGTISQGSYNTGTGFTSKAGAYTVAVSDMVLQNALGGNYKLRNNNKGTMTITPAVLYYQVDPVTYTQDDKNLIVPQFTGKVVNGAGIDVTKYLTEGDRERLHFMPSLDQGMHVGQYPVYGYGVMGSGNYRMADFPQMPGNERALTITPGTHGDQDYNNTPIPGTHDDKNYNNTPVPEDTRGKVELYYGPRDGRVKYGFGYNLEGLHVSQRYITIQDRGIHLDVANVGNSIIIDSISRADGSDIISIKRKSAVINNITMAE